MSISHNKQHIVNFLMIMLQLAILAPLFADPFTGGNSVDTRPQATRAPAGVLPDGFNIFQLKIREKSADFLDKFRNNPSYTSVGLFIMAVFFYGVLHGAGPGHRKTIVFTLFLARPARRWEPLAAGFLSAGLHAGTSLFLFVLFNIIWHSVSAFSSSENIAFFLEGWTFVLLAGFALILVFKKVFVIFKGHGSVNTIRDGKNIYLLLILSSLFPCPGATMLLILALSQNLIVLGVIGVVAMSLGMGIIISMAGYLGMAGRDRVFFWFKNREGGVEKINNIFELLSYTIVAAFSLWMGSPFLYWLLY